MALNFNVDPYYDDFDQTKNFHRILFKPGRAVQARELTQAQTILQDQITKFADNIFKQNSPVTGGQVTTNFDCHHIKLQFTYNDVAVDVTEFDGILIQNATGTVVARVLDVAPPTGVEGEGEPPTLVVSYKTGGHFQNNDIIYAVESTLVAQAAVNDATGRASTASIAEGVFYVEGNFVHISDSTIILDKYSNTPTKRVGISITETIYDYINDSSLLDPAVGASNFQAPGADRYVISLALDARPIQLGDDQSFFELVRVVNGEVQKLVEGSVYNVIDDYFAKRDYETNGNYVVNDFKLTPKTNEDPDLYTMSVGKGLAYVHGYRVENNIQKELTSSRARSTNSQNNGPVFIDYGSYFMVDSVRGANSSFFDITTTQTVDLHCVDTANVNTTNTSTYNATVVGSAYIRGLSYDSAADTSSGNTFIYRAYVHDVQNKVVSANATGGSATTITLPGTFSTSNTSYVGVNIQITQGPSTGDFRTITSYNGVTRVATVNQAWTTTPTTASVFSLNFDIKDIDSLVSVNGSRSVLSAANIHNSGRVGNVITGATILNNANNPELLFNVGAPYIASISDTSYTTQQIFRNVSFTSTGGSVQTQLNFEGPYLGIYKHFGTPNSTLTSEIIRQNYSVVVVNRGTNTTINNGDIIPWTTAGRTVVLDDDAAIATFTATDLSPFTATIVAKVFVQNAVNTGYVLKYKNLITANTQSVLNTNGTNVNTHTWVDDAALTSTGQVYIQSAGLVAPGQPQSLYLSDVKSIVKIIDTKASGNTATVAMLTNPFFDVTNNYIFDNGQRDSFYDHASITLRPGAPKPSGNLLVLLNYYQHSGGDGYFSLTSYLSSTNPENYTGIGSYQSKSGRRFSLRDCFDFRPARKNAQSDFIYRYSSTGPSNYGAVLPVDLTLFTSDYSFYLGRKDKLILSKDKSFQIVEGAPSLNPLFPAEPDGALVIANITHNPYTGYLPSEAPTGTISDLSVERVKHKRYTMQDIANIENRINNIEYYTSLSLLEQKTSSLQISDSYGLNRFKNGILVDDFSSFAAADTMSSDFSASINRRDRIMSATQNVLNFPLKSTALISNLGALSSTARTSVGYRISTDNNVNYFSLPFTTANVASQKFASRTVNANPFSFSNKEGTVSLSPNVDTWVDTNYAPSLLIIDPNLQVFRASNNINVLSAGDWKTVPGTTTTTRTFLRPGEAGNPNEFGGVVITDTYATQSQTNILGAYDKIGNTYALNNNYITDISILPYMRPQQIVVDAKGLLLRTPVDVYFGGRNVNNYVRKANIIELTGVSGTFNSGDTIGYYSNGVFTATGRIIAVYTKTATTVRLYVAADPFTTTYNNGITLQNGFFSAEGVYQNSTASGSVSSTQHFGGRVKTVGSSTSIVLSDLASSTNNYYNGNTIYIVSGTGAGQSAVISSYTGSTKTATLSSAITVAVGDIYSIGSFVTDETGSLYGIFNLPANTFHNGQRVLRIDNSLGNINAATTFAEGTFYAEGLQTTQQRVDYGASPAGAKNTFTQVNQKSNVLISSYTSPWDPVAQTFIIDKANHPNGIFLNSITVFFATKPTAEVAPITLSIVGTLNGYPNGETLDHSIVTKYPNEIKVSTAPQYLDSRTSTTFNFNAPVYIQPGVMYAFILKSNSKEYTLWTASNGDTAVASSTKNLPSDPTPSSVTKIGSAPYVGSLFLSQNSQTWSADQNQSLMFVIDRCVFSTSGSTISCVVPKKLPQRTLIDQAVAYRANANSISSTIDTISDTDILVDAFNITTTDFTPTATSISYSYDATLVSGSSTGSTSIIPGKFGTPTQNDIYLNDNRGQRILLANTNNSFTLNAQLSTTDNAVSPIISDAGLSTYVIQWNINNCELSNNLITVTDGGSSYNANATVVTFSAPTGKNGTQAYGVANVVGGIVRNIYVTSPGSGYITTPTVTITDGSSSGSGATAIVAGETGKNGGNANSRYVTKKVVLDQGFDSGDLSVILTAYRPINTDIHVYYKILNRNDTQKFEDGTWQLMTKINSCDSKYSQSRNDLIEYSFAPGTAGADQGYVSYTSTSGQVYNTFSQFAIKVVFTTSDKTFVPYATDMRCVALPSNVNTIF